MTKANTTSHQLTENTKLLQKAALVAGDKVLILKRSGEATSRPDCWDLPGGNCEWPEVTENRGGLHLEDLVREIEEETGIAIDEAVFDIASLVHFDTFFQADKQVYTIMANWWLQLPDNYPLDKVELSDEHIEYKWIAADEIEDYDFGGKKGEFVVNTIEEALACSQVFADEEIESGCCGGGCGGGHCH